MVKQEVLAALDGVRGQYISGQELAARLGVSRTAVWKAVAALRSDGIPIEAVTNRGYTLPKNVDVLNAAAIAAQMNADPMNALQIEVVDRLPGTNAALRARADDGAREGLVLIAQAQSAGRGRGGHSFYSPPGGLYLSVLLRPEIGARQAVSLTAMAAVAAARAAEGLCRTPIQIKWVNDLWKDGKKVCGILTEGALDLETGGLQYAIVGIGVNCFPPEGGFPEDLPEAGSVFAERPQGIEGRSQLAGAILNHFFEFYPNLAQRPFFEDYRKRSLVLGKEITVLEGNQTRTALALDLDQDFSLRVREADGTERTLSSGEVRVRPAKDRC